MQDFKQTYSYDFVPSSAARQTWLGTRKRSYSTGNIQFPGFYQTVDVQKDFGWFVLAILIEAVALSLTLYGGFSKGGVFVIAAIIVVVLFVVLDFIGVIFMHMNIENKCICKNKYILFPQDKPIIDVEYGKGKWRVVIGVMALILSSIFKIFAILLLGSFSSPIFYVVLSVFYLFVIYIHSVHTGYWFAEYKTNRMTKSDYNDWKTDKSDVSKAIKSEDQIRHNSCENLSVFISPIELGNITKGNPKVFARHSISLVDVINNGGTNEYKYEIRTFGILLDSEVIQCASGHLPLDASILGKECVKHQLQFHQ